MNTKVDYVVRSKKGWDVATFYDEVRATEMIAKSEKRGTALKLVKRTITEEEL